MKAKHFFPLQEQLTLDSLDKNAPTFNQIAISLQRKYM